MVEGDLLRGVCVCVCVHVCVCMCMHVCVRIVMEFMIFGHFLNKIPI